MQDEDHRIFALGDSALTVEFGTVISVEANQRALALAEHLEKNRFAGFIEAVPAYASTTIFYDLIKVRETFPEFPSAFDAVAARAKSALKTGEAREQKAGRKIEIPVDFRETAAPDLGFIAKTHGITTDEVIAIFTALPYRVFMLGFLPGFAYMGEVDVRIATPRKASPRLTVPKGSVGIAGRQTGIYSLDSPGGWQIIGRTDVPMFVPDSDPPSFLRPGDEVTFVVK